MKILLIGNFNGFMPRVCGQITKTILYKQILEKDGNELTCLDLSKLKKKPFSLIRKIKKNLKWCDIVIALPGPRSCYFILSIIAFFNKRSRKRFVYSEIGTGILSRHLDSKNYKQNIEFYNTGCKFKKPSIVEKFIVKSCSIILVETELLLNTHKSFYGDKNFVLLTNFRDEEPRADIKDENTSQSLNICFCARIVSEKGIFDLMNATNFINKDKKLLNLTIFGDKSYLNKKEQKEFNKLLNYNISYGGILKSSDVVNKLAKYDLLVFPSKFAGEGAPGTIIESLISGTPVLSSNFFQAQYILKNGFDSILFEQNNINDLINKLSLLIFDRKLLLKLKKNTLLTRKKYLFSECKDMFYQYIYGSLND